jgi:hypothetical protein
MVISGVSIIAPCSARPDNPSAIPIAEADDQPEVRARGMAVADGIETGTEIEVVKVEVRSEDNPASAEVLVKNVRADGPPQIVPGAPEQGMLQLVDGLFKLAPLLKTFPQ